jgi:hypothetical protein
MAKQAERHNKQSKRRYNSSNAERRINGAKQR